MADGRATALPGIAALPLTTARQIGSGQVLVDPSSLVKELIDNALDARARSVFVDISANTIDTIQVKDDGHGIPTEDRNLVCRRYCTSKIRDFHDLKEVGGTWLGFRGEALSSAAEMSGTLAITTRVEGEPVAVKLKYGRDGELITTERESQPVGTTVKALQLFERIPVRKQTATKNSAKCLAKIRRLVQAYALARPAVRFRLHVLKATNNKADFMYAPKAQSNVEDAVLKVIGKDCALQCDWTAIEDDGFEVHAFLPKPTATGAKIANQGAFISVDARPVSYNRGTMKQIVSTFKEKLRETSTSLSNVKDPFFCMNIVCPPGSYDPNIEPAKDDVMFDDGSTVLKAVRKLLEAYYPKAVVQEENDAPTSAQQPPEYEEEDITSSSPVEKVTHLKPREMLEEELSSATPSRKPQWRSSMYGIDEDDLVHLNEDQSPIVEEEDGRREADICNPWTIARMNASVKPNRSTANEQLLSPAKSFAETQVRSSSPAGQKTPLHVSAVNVLTPRTSPAALNAFAAPSARVDGRQTQQQRDEDPFITMHVNDESSPPHGISTTKTAAREANTIVPPPMTRVPHSFQQSSDPSPRKQKALTQEAAATSPEGPLETWFGQPMRGSQARQSPRKVQQEKNRQPRLSNSHPQQSRSARSEDPLVETILYSENNTDIRDFLGHDRAAAPISGQSHTIDPSFGSSGSVSRRIGNTEIVSFHQGLGACKQQRPLSQPSNTAYRHGEAHRGSSQAEPHQYPTLGDHSHAPYPVRPYSMESDYQSLPARQSADMPLHVESKRHKIDGQGNRDMAAYFKAYQDREEAFVDQSASPTRRQNLRIPPTHEHASDHGPRRRRTTDGLQRTKSSKLPLERVPQGHHLQNFILRLNASIVAIIQSASRLDMRSNSLEWPYAVTDDAYNAFVQPITATMVMNWVVRLDAKLANKFEPLPGADVRSLLHEAVQRGLDEKQDRVTMDKVMMMPTSKPMVDIIKDADAPVRAVDDIAQPPLPPTGNVEDETSEFDMSQFFDLDAALSDEVKPGLENQHEVLKEGDEEFEDAIEDDMLLDL